MAKKLTLLATALLLSLVAISAYLLNAQQIQRIVNHFLQPDYALVFGNDMDVGVTHANLPSLSLKSEQAHCQLVNLQHIQAHWWDNSSLIIDKAELDYACLMALPTHQHSDESFNIAAILAWLPNLVVQINEFKVINTESVKNPELHQLLNERFKLSMVNQAGTLSLDAQQIDQGSTGFSGHFQLAGEQFSAQVNYQPQAKQIYELHSQLQLKNDFSQLPTQGELTLNWQRDDFAVPKGEMRLQWQNQQGNLTVQDMDQNQQLAKLPFEFDDRQIQLKNASFFWQASETLPLNLNVDLTLSKKGDNWLPLIPDLHIKLIWPGIRDNLSIASRGGEFSESHFTLPLEAHGNIKYDENIVYNDLLLTIGGEYSDPKVQFLTDSFLHVAKKHNGSNILITVPLEGIEVSKYGVNGRLQAHLEGVTPQFDNLDLKLDGQANEFIAGVKSIFSLRDEDNQLAFSQKMAKNQWVWTFTGMGKSKLLHTPFHFLGKGEWRDNHIQIQQLNANTEEIKLGGINIPKIELQQIENMQWDYEQADLRGALQVSSPKILFNYGGVLEQPKIVLALKGKTPSDFKVAGKLSAGKLGPINLQTRYQNETLDGQLDWQPQSAKVFQSLFPQQWQMLIQEGTIQGNSAFNLHLTEGFRAKGKVEILSGSVILPDSEINGIRITLPYEFANNQLSFKQHPVQVQVQQIKSGELELNNLSVKVNGYYPYTAQKPLRLSELRLDLFGGNLTVNKFALPQRQIADLRFQQIDLAKILAFAQYTQIELTGRINAVFPFWLTHPSCLICNGEIEQAEDIHLRISEPMAKALKKGGWTESILVDLVDQLDFQQLNAKINFAPDGMMRLNSQLRGYNPKKQHSGMINLNYNHQENLFDLWKMVDYGSQFEQNLQHNLYQQLESK